jgi:hypothetical protein
LAYHLANPLASQPIQSGKSISYQTSAAAELGNSLDLKAKMGQVNRIGSRPDSASSTAATATSLL